VIGIELTFLAGRYHATPWDAHVNEGVIEWPPSPWRILRALIATCHLKAQDRVSQEILEKLVAALSEELPSYALPAHSAGFHTRHYMPLFSHKTTKVFDTFLHLPEGERVVVAWPTTTLDEGLASALGCLVERLGYLGRAEAWVEARLATSEDRTATEHDLRARSERQLAEPLVIRSSRRSSSIVISTGAPASELTVNCCVSRSQYHLGAAVCGVRIASRA
jgi:CRISPR-associated protein Csb2